jgi:hypothetical protein
MSNEAADRQQQKISEFLRLLPLTVELAGLPRADHGRMFNEGQLEIRANAIRAAYKFARQIIVEVAKESSQAQP